MTASDRKPRLDAAAAALLLLCCAIWGINQVAAKVALAEIPPLAQAGARSLGGAVLVALWARWRGVALVPDRAILVPGVLAGLLFALEFGCIFAGLQHTAASRMVVFIYLAPFVVALGMPTITGSERLDLVQLGGLLAAFAGVAWAFGEGFQRPAVGERQWLGDALGLAAALLWGGTTLVIRGSRLSTAAPEVTLLYQLVVSGVALGLASPLAGERWPAAVGSLSLGLLGFQIVVVTAFSYLLWFWLVRHYPATQLSAFTLLTPLFGLAAGVVLLDEPMSPRLALACAAVVAGIALVSRRPAR